MDADGMTALAPVLQHMTGLAELALVGQFGDVHACSWHLVTRIGGGNRMK